MIQTEMVVLKYFLNKENFLYFGKFFKSLNLEPEIERILQTIEEYYIQNQDAETIDVDELSIYFSVIHPSLSKDNIYYSNIFNVLKNINTKEYIINTIILRVVEKYLSTEVIEILSDILNDEAVDVLKPTLAAALEKFSDIEERLSGAKGEDDFISPDLEELLETEMSTENGLFWGLECLNASIGPLRRNGSVGHVFARPDIGKTSFLVSQVTAFAPQLKDDEIIVWFGNEEKGSRIQVRLYCSALSAPKEVLMRNVQGSKDAFKRYNGTAIKIFDNSTMSVVDIERILKKYNTRVVIIDQGDAVRIRGDKNLAEHERLKKLYRRFRELAIQYNCDIITAGQASAQAEGIACLNLTHMDNSKTGKPGALDYAIGIGTSSLDQRDYSRYISVCKNKLHNGQKGKFEVYFDALIAKFSDHSGDTDSGI